jgi:hypothetical protein
MNPDAFVHPQFGPRQLREALKDAGIKPVDARALVGMMFQRTVKQRAVFEKGKHDALTFLLRKGLVEARTVKCSCGGPCGEVYTYVQLI